MTNALNALELSPMSVTSKALSENFSLEEKARRQEATSNKDFYYGKQENDVVLANDDVEPMTMNLTRPIMTKRSNMLYSRPLKREFIGPSESGRFLEQVYKDNSIDALLLKVDLMAELTGSCLLHPLNDDAYKSKVRLVPYDASQFSAAGNDDDPSTADAITLLRIVDRVVDNNALGVRSSPQVERVIQQQVWTTTTVIYTSGATAGPEAIQNSVVHNLGFLPFVNFMGEEVHDQYIGFPNATNVVKMNRNINQMLTHLSYLIKMEAHTPIVAAGWQPGDSITWHAGRMIAAPSGAQVYSVGTSPHIVEALAAIQYLEDRLYATSSVPKISVEGGGGGDGGMFRDSGKSLLIQWFPLLQVFQEKAVRYARYELQLANMILQLNGMPLLEDVQVEFPEDGILPFSPEDENLERDLNLNLTSVIDEILKRNPQLDPNEALLQLKENQRINKENKPDEPNPALGGAKPDTTESPTSRPDTSSPGTGKGAK